MEERKEREKNKIQREKEEDKKKKFAEHLHWISWIYKSMNTFPFFAVDFCHKTLKTYAQVQNWCLDMRSLKS